jgi:hypothetical protein
MSSRRQFLVPAAMPLAREGKDVVVTRGRTLENEANQAPTFLADR